MYYRIEVSENGKDWFGPCEWDATHPANQWVEAFSYFSLPCLTDGVFQHDGEGWVNVNQPISFFTQEGWEEYIDPEGFWIDPYTDERLSFNFKQLFVKNCLKNSLQWRLHVLCDMQLPGPIVAQDSRQILVDGSPDTGAVVFNQRSSLPGYGDDLWNGWGI